MPDAGNFNALLTTAETYRDLGYSVIPLRGKVATIPWTAFQRRKPELDLLKSWFSNPTITGVGILTGWISGIVVLDFDSQAVYDDFRTQCGSLADTRTVRTRRGWHLYYQLPPTLNLASQSLQEMDIQSHGRYVVAPPSIVDGHIYAIEGRNPTKTLQQADLVVLQAYNNTRRSAVSQILTFSREIEAFQDPANRFRQLSTPFLAPAELVSLYKHLVGKNGRNKALFYAGIHARDHGWAQSETRNLLVDIHNKQPTPRGHRRESEQDRQKEAAATIASAYSRPPGKAKRSTLLNKQLPNTVRETLFGLKMTYAIRTIEALRLKGIQPGQVFTRQASIDLLRGIVGRDSIDHALNAAIGAPLFTPVPPSGHPQVPAGLPSNDVCKKQKKCYFVGDKKPGKITSAPFLPLSTPSNTGRAGRKAHVFMMPSNTELCELLGVTDSGGDSMTLNDLRTAPGLRKAVHRELIRRRPGTYTRKWLADRLGVCLITLDTYNRDIPINIMHSFTREKIGWHNLEQVQEEKIDPSIFLTDENGKKYPALRVIAAKLLKQKHTVYLMRQRPSFYYYGEIPQTQFPVCGKVMPLQAAQETESVAARSKFAKPIQPAATPPASALPTTTHQLLLPEMPFTAHAPKPLPKPRPELRYRDVTKPIENSLDEKLAQDIHELTKPNGLSIMNARKLVSTYGFAAAGKGLANLCARVQRDPDAVKSRAGLLITMVRGYWKQAHERERTIQFTPVKPRQTKRAQQVRKRTSRAGGTSPNL